MKKLHLQQGVKLNYFPGALDKIQSIVFIFEPQNNFRGVFLIFFFQSIASFAFLCTTADISRSTQHELFNSGEKSASTFHSLLSSALHSLAQQTSVTGTFCQALTLLWVLVRDKLKCELRNYGTVIFSRRNSDSIYDSGDLGRELVSTY